jgi:hypothetical protein
VTKTRLYVRGWEQKVEYNRNRNVIIPGFCLTVLFVATITVDVTELGTSVTSDSSLFFLFQT